MRIGVLGFGSIGRRHVCNLIEMGEKDLFVYDCAQPYPAPGDAGHIRYVKMATSEQELCDWQPEAVLICTPPATHYRLAMQAIESGAHLFIEKPLATHVLEANDIVWLNNDKKVLAVGYQLRFHAMTELRRNENISSWFFSLQDMGQWTSLYKKDVLEEFSHEIDLAVRTNGPAEALTATVNDGMWNIQLRHLGGTSWLMLSGTSKHSFRYANQKNVKVWEFNGTENDQAYKWELKAFLRACRGEGWDDRLCSGPEAVHVCRIIAAARESAQQCKVVHLA